MLGPRPRINRQTAWKMFDVSGHHPQVEASGNRADQRVVVGQWMVFGYCHQPPPLESRGFIKHKDGTRVILEDELEITLQLTATFAFGLEFNPGPQFRQS